MTFPDGSHDPESDRRLLGDVAVCVDVAREEARERDPALVEHLAGEECILYIVHGLLHLLGYDDVEESDRREMWQRQRELLARIGIALDPEPDPDIKLTAQTIRQARNQRKMW